MDDKLVRLSDVKALFHRGDERTFPFSFPGLVTERDVDSIPAVDAVEVVRCRECRLRGICSTEDVFRFAGLSEENRYCGAGRRREEEHNAAD